MLVYDQMDTEGKALPEGVPAFAAHGAVDHLALEGFALRLIKKGIQWNKVDAGDLSAGSIEVVLRAKKISEPSSYRMDVNQNHDANVQFATVAHELAHLFLGIWVPTNGLLCRFAHPFSRRGVSWKQSPSRLSSVLATGL